VKVCGQVTETKAEFGPDRRFAAAATAGALVLAGLAIATTDPQQRILAVIAALALAVNAAVDLYFWPRLSVTTRGLTLRTPTTRTELPWTSAPIIRVDERTRLGLASHTLEIDAGELLVVLSRHALGADPQDVLDILQSLRPDERPAV
jgi:Bacterial PH domain